MVSLNSLALVLALSSSVPAEGAGETVLIDFSADWCGPCRTMEPVVGQLSSAGFPVRKVNIDRQPDLAARYQVTSIPCFVMVVDGKEVDRVVGVASYGQLEQMLSRASVQPPGASNPTTVAQSPDTLPAARQLTVPAHNSDRDPLSGAGTFGTDMDVPSSVPASAVADAAPLVTTSRGRTEQLLRSAVRIKVDDATGHSFGTGTIVDARTGEALVLTCGHLFRDSKGKGPISVDVFCPDGVKTVEGQLISYDLDRDLGFISIRPPGPVEVTRVAAKGRQISPGERVISIGCNGGADPTVHQTHVTAIDRYAGPPNIEAAGMPVEGRSGGGLFDEQGQLVGVCFAADSADDEGLYAGLDSIQAELDRLGLQDVYSPIAAVPVQQASLARTEPPAMAREMPESNETASPPAAMPEAVSEAASPLSSAELASLQEIRSRSQDAEVICIIRPRDAQAKSEIIVLNDVSQGFLQQLTGSRKEQASRRLTSLEVPHRSVPVGVRSSTETIDWRSK